MMPLTSHLSLLTSQEDTICALATAPGGALGIIRISGPQSLEILSHVFHGSGDVLTYPANTTHFGRIVEYDAVSQHPHPLDEVLLSIFRAPHSYTGEDSAEISCHGSSYILHKILDLLIANGCRMAHPGEYTQRAYLNGKMDLSQAEAVADLIASTNKATHQMAMSQLRGHFSSELARLRDQLLKLTSLLELELDFSDHEDLEFADRSELLELTKIIDCHITSLAHSFETGQALKQGIPVAIVGKTNVGKSTLLNRLLKDDRAIVSDIHGTTRDTIEDTIDIQGITFRFIDTAGIRQTTDEVEQIGISRTYAAIEKARIVLWLIDTEPTSEELQEMQERCKDKSLIIIVNKIDKLSDESAKELSSHLSPLTTHLSPLTPHLLTISAKFDTNLNDLESAIYQTADIPSIRENDIIVTNARHYDSLTRAHEHLLRVLDGLNNNLSGDLLSEDLHLTLDTLAEITGGQITPNEVLGNIFKNFCVGK
jgi:tRNA modification GTPase